MEALIFRRFLNDNQLTKSKLEVYLQGAQNSINAHYNIDFNGRAVVEMIHTISMTTDTEMQTLSARKKGAKHGTHVCGIIASSRNNDNGNRGFLITPN